MKRRAFFPFGLMAATTLLISLIQPNTLRAQALMSYRVGDTPTKLSRLGPVSGEDKYKGMDLFKWVLPNRNMLTATVDAEGEIVYLESDWGGKSDDTGCDLAGLKFGVTTLADLEARLGSTGFSFRTRPHSRPADDGVMLLNSYEVGNVVVTFYTRISGADYARLQAGTTNTGGAAAGAEFARLEGISMANAAYAKSEWGARIPNPAYKKVDWK